MALGPWLQMVTVRPQPIASVELPITPNASPSSRLHARRQGGKSAVRSAARRLGTFLAPAIPLAPAAAVRVTPKKRCNAIALAVASTARVASVTDHFVKRGRVAALE